MVDFFKVRFILVLFFSYVSFDVFGLWLVRIWRTRGDVANNKRQVVFFICLIIRVIYMELIEFMDVFSFINVLRRFLVLRGLVIQFRFDRGINFIGVYNELQFCFEVMNNLIVQLYLFFEGCEWIFNFFYVFYIGGVWERMIGVVRCILDFIFVDISFVCFTYKVFLTFMVEVIVIVNVRFLVLVFIDLDMLEVFILSILFIQKFQSLKVVFGNFS